MQQIKARESRADDGTATPEEAALVQQTRTRFAAALDSTSRLHELGVKLVAGSDAGWRHTRFDNFHRELGHLVSAGLTPLDAIHAATGKRFRTYPIPAERLKT